MYLLFGLAGQCLIYSAAADPPPYNLNAIPPLPPHQPDAAPSNTESGSGLSLHFRKDDFVPIPDMVPMPIEQDTPHKPLKVTIPNINANQPAQPPRQALVQPGSGAPVNSATAASLAPASGPAAPVNLVPHIFSSYSPSAAPAPAQAPAMQAPPPLPMPPRQPETAQRLPASMPPPAAQPVMPVQAQARPLPWQTANAPVPQPMPPAPSAGQNGNAAVLQELIGRPDENAPPVNSGQRPQNPSLAQQFLSQKPRRNSFAPPTINPLATVDAAPVMAVSSANVPPPLPSYTMPPQPSAAGLTAEVARTETVLPPDSRNGSRNNYSRTPQVNTVASTYVTPTEPPVSRTVPPVAPQPSYMAATGPPAAPVTLYQPPAFIAQKAMPHVVSPQTRVASLPSNNAPNPSRYATLQPAAGADSEGMNTPLIPLNDAPAAPPATATAPVTAPAPPDETGPADLANAGPATGRHPIGQLSDTASMPANSMPPIAPAPTPLLSIAQPMPAQPHPANPSAMAPLLAGPPPSAPMQPIAQSPIAAPAPDTMRVAQTPASAPSIAPAPVKNAEPRTITPLLATPSIPPSTATQTATAQPVPPSSAQGLPDVPSSAVRKWDGPDAFHATAPSAPNPATAPAQVAVQAPPLPVSQTTPASSQLAQDEKPVKTEDDNEKDDSSAPDKSAKKTETADGTEPKREVSEASKKIVDKIPSNLAQKKQAPKTPVEVEHAKDLSAIDKTTTAQASTATQNAMGIRIEVKTPAINLNYELEKAYNALVSGQPSTAIEIYKNVLDNDGNNKNALFGLATTYHRAGQLDLARPLYAKLLTLDPNNRDGLNNFLVLLSDEAPENAVTQLEALQQRNPDFSPIPAQIAVIYLKLGMTDKANANMLRAIELAPENLTYRYNLAIMLDRQRKYDEAAQLYRQIIQAYQRGEKVPGDIQKIQQRLTFISSNRP